MKNRKKYVFVPKREFLMVAVLLILSLLFFNMLVQADDRKEAASLYKYYTSVPIHPGDTLWDIASKYCGNADRLPEYVQELKQINHLKNDEIHAGRYLTVVYYSEEYK
jgi:hypothetical protein